MIQKLLNGGVGGVRHPHFRRINKQFLLVTFLLQLFALFSRQPHKWWTDWESNPECLRARQELSRLTISPYTSRNRI